MYMHKSQSSKRQILVSGATGFIGQHLIPKLLNKDYEVTAIVRSLKKAKKFSWCKEVKLISGDIQTLSQETFRFNTTSGLIHLAWEGLPNFESPHHLEENLPVNYAFIKSLVDQGLEQILVTGTCLEYGMQYGPIPSNANTFPSNPYALAKDTLRKQLEHLAQSHEFCCQWARLFYMFGRGQHHQSLLPKLESAIQQNKLTFEMSLGEQIRDYLPVEEVAKQIISIFETHQAGNFNVCAGEPISVRRLVESKIAALESSITPVTNSLPYPEYEPLAFWGIPENFEEPDLLPAIPNAPLKCKKNFFRSVAPMALRLNDDLGLLENAAFEIDRIDYSQGYENSQVHSDKFQRHMSSVLQLLKNNFPKGSRVVEVGCGKGDFLEMVVEDGYFQIRGFDASYSGSNKKIEQKYLNESDSIDADLIVLRHVLEHIKNPLSFLKMLRHIFGDTYIYIEVPCFDWIRKNQTFFDITYEHVNYFSQLSLKKLFEKTSSQHGVFFEEQYQYVIAGLQALNPDFEKIYNSVNWKSVSMEQLFPNLVNCIDKYENLAKGRSIFVWGAATKGCLFLAHCAKQNKIIDKVKFAIDQNPKKIGKYLAGSLVRIGSKEEFFAEVRLDDLLIIANPAYRREIEAEIVKANIPEITIVNL